MAIAKILEHGQITIPKPIRESLGFVSPKNPRNPCNLWKSVIQTID